MELMTQYGADLLFYLFAAAALVSAVLVISLRQPVYSAIALLASFLSVAGIFFVLHAEFLGVVQIFVYGGGIMVLFIFVIMLVNLRELPRHRTFVRQLGPAIVIALLLVVWVGLFLVQVDLGAAFTDPASFQWVDGETVGNSEAVSMVLFQKYLLPFEVASLFLLVAMIGAVILGRET